MQCTANIDIPKLSVESKDILDQPFSKKELYDSLMLMKQNKTPGYDGFPTEFYIVFLARYFRHVV